MAATGSIRKLEVKTGGGMDDDVKPFIPANKRIPELTLMPLIMGTLLGILFGASSLYLVLKVGMTVSASIPVAVMSITLFRGFAKVFGQRQATILENNITQTTGSAGESIAFGVAVTMPALFILGYGMDVSRVMTVAILGGILGILMMIPLRWALIVREHKTLTYPEGTACAEVLIVGEKGGTSAKTVFTGFGIGFIYKFLNVALHWWQDVSGIAVSGFKGAVFSCEVSPELLGVGYVIGPRIAAIMMAGGVASAFVLIPAIYLFGHSQTEPMFPATKLINDMSPHEIWRAYVLYIGSGAVATGGIISLFRSLPVIWHSLLAGLQSIKKTGVGGAQAIGQLVKRTERDIPMKYVLIGCGLLVLGIWVAPSMQMNLLGAILIVLFGFLFVTVASRITGEIGSSSSPISGMTVATLLLTSLIFVLVGWIGPEYRVTVLSIGAIVCIAASQGGTTSQDLKTGHLVGSTPISQQIAIIVGTVTSAVVIGYTLLALNAGSTIFHKVDFPKFTADAAALTTLENVEGPEAAKDQNAYYALHITEKVGDVMPGKYLADADGKLRYLVDPGINGTLSKRDDGTPVTKYEAPKARLMALIIDGIMTRKLPWSLVLLGVFMSLAFELCGVQSLPFAVGLYLPMSSSTPLFVGGMVRWLADRTRKTPAKSETDSESSPGVLLSSGLIAGGSIAGILVAFLMFNESLPQKLDMSALFGALAESQWVPYIWFGALIAFLFAGAKEWILKPKTERA